ncbi:tetratricopeptide repeat protein [Humisphaera borealis]|uniref:Tetratricopeptide repeat protein n=1 Tax=Humisphaera borealis TaxID=2807512 RepID=A0A7M2X345_9BACT|nr:hypothetical protein [Humisphaera borealis]QOV92186.1 hypothetical protein IPV69_12860 [Humisphaera borealis]
MNLPSYRSISRVASVGLLCASAAFAGLSAGCGEIVTYAGEARQQGIKLYNEGHYAEAAGSFNSAIKQRPQDYESYYYLGRTHEAMGAFHQAVKDYRTTLTMMDNSLKGPTDTEFRLKTLDGLASAISAGKDATLEQAAFVKTSGPATGEDFWVIAKVRKLDGDIDSALVEYAKAAKMDPENQPLAKEFGLYLAKLNQRTLASAELRRAYAINYRKRLADDPQVNEGLRALGIIPGPSLADERDLHQPILPVGPLPEVKVQIGKEAAKAE